VRKCKPCTREGVTAQKNKGKRTLLVLPLLLPTDIMRGSIANESDMLF
jgi:hypothetical protein